MLTEQMAAATLSQFQCPTEIAVSTARPCGHHSAAKAGIPDPAAASATRHSPPSSARRKILDMLPAVGHVIRLEMFTLQARFLIS